MLTRILLPVICLLCLSPAVFADIEKELLERLQSSYLPDNNINLAESALILSKTIYPKIEMKSYLEMVDTIADEVRERLKSGTTHNPTEIIEEINRSFNKRKIKAESILSKTPSLLSESERDKFLFSKVLDTMSGNCLGLTTLYWSIAERLDLPLCAVIIPQHVFLRYYEGKEYRNIEPTACGAEIEDKEYIKQTRKLVGDKIPIYSTPDRINFYVLSKKKFIGLILYNRGADYANRNNPAKAMNDFNMALRLYEDFYEGYKARAGLYLKDGKYQETIRDLKEADTFEPDCPATWFNLGSAYFGLKEFSEALQYFERTIRLVPQYLEAYHQRGLCYAQQNQTNLAIEDLSFVIKSSPSARVYYDRGAIYLNMKKYNDAIVDFTNAISLDEKFSDAFNNRAIANASQERFSEAVKDFEKAIQLKPDNPSYHKNLGIAFYRMKEYPRALKALQKYLSLNPDDEEAISLVKQLSPAGGK
ncbi:MAG: tetratricopeptide repeat protein [Planctomycetota bacterium]|nr:tetratricopeptide repeat protein [Planctomycetota bacterium]MDI6788343.1 tetratricopeptide repeat protein [Planctomycetota bacterium]